MPKRPLDATAGDSYEQRHKKQHRHDHSQGYHQNPRQGDPAVRQYTHGQPTKPLQPASTTTPAAALQLLPPATTTLGPVPGLNSAPSPMDPSLPPLPPIPEGPLRSAPFRHKSTATYDRSLATASAAAAQDTSYERLEFLGDAYIELMASRLIFARFAHLPAGAMSQLREQLVKNETLCGYGRAYGFDRRVDVADFSRMRADARDRGNKGLNKVVGDVFEAYVAAVVLGDPQGGFAVAETWLTALWAPKLAEAAAADRLYLPATAEGADVGEEEGKVSGVRRYDSAAKSTLQRRILRDATVKLAYEPYKQSVELKGAQLGQNRHYIALYLSGFGYERKLLGKGEGKNKVEAGNWAAMEAMHGLGKEVVDECEQQVLAAKGAKAVAKAAAAAAYTELQEQQQSLASGPGHADSDG